MRALAITLVILYHFFPKIIPGGYVGVDVFFVISGFLITSIILHDLEMESFSISNFYEKRVRRLFPSLLLVMSSTLVVGYFILLPNEYERLGYGAIAGLAFFANISQYYKVGYFDIDSANWQLAHLWSLGIEEQFYLFWPLLLSLIWKYFGNSLVANKKLLITTALMFLVSFLININNVSWRPEWVFYMPFTRLWELLLGGLLAIIPASDVLSKKLKSFFVVLGIFLVLAGAFILNQKSIFPGIAALMPTVGAALAIYYGNQGDVEGNFLSRRSIVCIGLISYPLFLWHWPLLSFAYILKDGALDAITKIIVLLLTFILSVITYIGIEKPIRRSKNKNIAKTLIGINIVLILLSLTIVYGNGLPKRMNGIMGGLPPNELIRISQSDFYSRIDKKWRTRKCFLEKDQGWVGFSSDCVGAPNSIKIFIWGDSHAAALYSGLEEFVVRHQLSWQLSQYTTSACPPILGYSGFINKNCKEINEQNFHLIKRLNPDVVILEAAWYWDEYDLSRLSGTIRDLKDLGNIKIIVIGPTPNWVEPVPKVLIKYYTTYKTLPYAHTNFMLDVDRIKKVDLEVAEIARQNSVDYVSLYDSFCNARGCLTMLGQSVDDIVSYDTGHLSPAAALFVFESLGSHFIH